MYTLLEMFHMAFQFVFDPAKTYGEAIKELSLIQDEEEKMMNNLKIIKQSKLIRNLTRRKFS